MIHTVKGDIFTNKEGVIVHQTNCAGGFGGPRSMAGQIAKLYPQVRAAYFKLYYENQKHPTESLLGTYQSVKVSETLTIVNLFGQYYYRTNPKDTTTVFTDYQALETALRKLEQHVPKDTPIFFPYGFGCGLANGHWPTIHKILNKVFRKRDNVFIVQFEKFD